MRNMEAERVPLQELGHRNEKINDEISIDFCNERSRIRRNKAEDSTTFIFNYEK